MSECSRLVGPGLQSPAQPRVLPEFRVDGTDDDFGVHTHRDLQFIVGQPDHNPPFALEQSSLSHKGFHDDRFEGSGGNLEFLPANKVGINTLLSSKSTSKQGTGKPQALPKPSEKDGAP